MQILPAYGLLKETVSTIMMLNKNMKAMVHSPDGDTNFFDIVTGVLQGDTLASYMFIKVSKVGDCSRGQPEGSLFNSYYTEV